MLDKLHEECGVFGIFGNSEAARLTYLGLYALQHRGQESAGIASTNGTTVYVHKAMGLVMDIFTEAVLERLPGSLAMGHVRYSTAGGSMLCNAQPIVASTSKGMIAVAHNGNLVNGNELRRTLEACKVACRSCSEECAQHASLHEHCRICAEACRRCEDACNRVLSAIG